MTAAHEESGAKAARRGLGGTEASTLAVFGGTIHALDAGCPRPEVLVVRDGRVLAIGGRQLLAEHPRTRQVDLRGAVVVPGLIDAHAHVMGLGQVRDEIDLRRCASWQDVVRSVRVVADAEVAGHLVMGRGWNEELWHDRRPPSHHALSAAVPNHPVLLRRVDGHAMLANACAMRLAGLTAHTEPPAGGSLTRDADGSPAGLFVDAAMALLPRPSPPTRQRRERWVLAAQEACLRAGLTCVHDAGADADTLAVFSDLMSEGRLELRLNVFLEGAFDAADKPASWLAERLVAGPMAGLHDGRLSARGVKLFADGALGSHGAALLAPYADDPTTHGLHALAPRQLRERVRACRAAGFQVAVHAIGDEANRRTLDALAADLAAHPAEDHRLRVEHAQVVSYEDVPRFAQLGVIASVQPIHATADMAMASERLGAARLRDAYRWRSLLDGGVRLAFGSDFPVEDERPLLGMHAAVAREARGVAVPEGWADGEKVTRAEALAGYTTWAAAAGFQEREIGSLTPGKRADFVVLSEDPLACPLDRLPHVGIESTWIGGVEVFTAARPTG